MKVLVACECSGTVRDAFTRAGHTAMSVDLKPSLSSGDHYQGDVFDVINQGWDLMVAFPPCTYLAKAQQWRYQYESKRPQLRDEAMYFVNDLFRAPIPRIAIENPVGYLNHNWRPPTQICYPYMFGDPYRKEICWWLKNLPPLIGTLYNPVRKSIANHTNGRMSQDLKSEIKSSWKYYPGLAAAIVDQWGNYY